MYLGSIWEDDYRTKKGKGKKRERAGKSAAVQHPKLLANVDLETDGANVEARFLREKLGGQSRDMGALEEKLHGTPQRSPGPNGQIYDHYFSVESKQRQINKHNSFIFTLL